jgi:hypothetical protein
VDGLAGGQAAPGGSGRRRGPVRRGELLLRFIAATRRTPPQDLDLADVDADVIGAFLTHLETERHNEVALVDNLDVEVPDDGRPFGDDDDLNGIHLRGVLEVADKPALVGSWTAAGPLGKRRASW